MAQSRSTALTRHQKKERWGTNKDNTDATYETTDTERKKERKKERTIKRDRLGTVNMKITGGLN